MRGEVEREKERGEGRLEYTAEQRAIDPEYIEGSRTGLTSPALTKETLHYSHLRAEAQQVQGLHRLCDGLVESFIPHHPLVLADAESVLLVRDIVVNSPPMRKLRRGRMKNHG